jgi:hypothetical protein
MSPWQNPHRQLRQYNNESGVFQVQWEVVPQNLQVKALLRAGAVIVLLHKCDIWSARVQIDHQRGYGGRTGIEREQVYGDVEGI